MRSRQAALGALLLGGLVGGVAVADGAPSPVWQHLAPAEHPSARAAAAAAWDPRHHEVVLFGGWTGRDAAHAVALGDTWTYDARGWHRRRPGPGPSPRFGATLAWDGDQLVLFGGTSSSGVDRPFGDTWTWTGTSWSPSRGTARPAARAFSAAAFDGTAMVLFGGVGPGGALDDTWSFRRGVWRALAPASHPGARAHAPAVAAPGLGGAVLYGGTGDRPQGDTWLFAHATWRRLASGCPAPSCPAAGASALAQSPDGSPLLYSGHGSRQLWQLTGGAWQPLPVRLGPPAARSDAVLVGLPSADAVLLFGGAAVASPHPPYGDTWRLAFPSGLGTTAPVGGPPRTPLPAPTGQGQPTGPPTAVPTASPTPSATPTPSGTGSPSGGPTPSRTGGGPQGTSHHHEQGVPGALSVLAAVMLGAAGFATWLVRSRRLL